MNMAKPVCTYCDTYEGHLLVTVLDDGETQSVCGNDLLMWALSMTATLTEGMTLDQAEAYSEQLDAIRANDPRPTKPAGRKRAPRATAEPVAPVPPGGAELADLTRVELPIPCESCGSETALGDSHKLVCEGCGAVIATADEAV
jgi:hypothetical protein